jgi:hypothetical protein
VDEWHWNSGCTCAILRQYLYFGTRKASKLSDLDVCKEQRVLASHLRACRCSVYWIYSTNVQILTVYKWQWKSGWTCTKARMLTYADAC